MYFLLADNDRSNINYTFLNRNAFEITETELKLIAAATNPSQNPFLQIHAFLTPFFFKFIAMQ